VFKRQHPTAYNLPPTCFSPSWAIFKQPQEINYEQTGVIL